jgi:hypothetical protein
MARLSIFAALFACHPAVAEQRAPIPVGQLAAPGSHHERQRIGDPKIAAPAWVLASHAETWVVAPRDDRSGSGHSLSVRCAASCR